MDSHQELQRPLVNGQQLMMTQFQEARKGGYVKEEVHVALAHAATAIDTLFARVAELENALADATRAPAPAPSAAEMTRTLEIAARAAQMVESEARNEAEKLIAAANATAANTIDSANTEAAKVRSDADSYAAVTREEAKVILAEARDAAAGARERAEAQIADLRVDIDRLESDRAGIEAKLAAKLDAHTAQMDEIRRRVADALEHARTQLLATPLGGHTRVSPPVAETTRPSAGLLAARPPADAATKTPPPAPASDERAGAADVTAAPVADEPIADEPADEPRFAEESRTADSPTDISVDEPGTLDAAPGGGWWEAHEAGADSFFAAAGGRTSPAEAATSHAPDTSAPGEGDANDGGTADARWADDILNDWKPKSGNWLDD